MRYTTLAITLLAILTLPRAIGDTHSSTTSLSYTQRALSSHANPAAANLVIRRKDPHLMTGGMLEVGVGVEYGDIDNLLDLINDLKNDFEPSEPAPPPGEIPPPGDDDIDWDKIFEMYPDLEDRLDQVKKEATRRAAYFALIAAEGYGKAELYLDSPWVIKEDLWGGSLIGSISARGNSKAIGLFENIEFDADIAKDSLSQIPTFGPNDGIQELDLSAGLTLHYDPLNRRAKLTIDNDSLLLVKATKIYEFSLSYSNQLLATDYGELYVGVQPTVYRVGLTNITTRLGDVNDANEILEDIFNGDYRYETGFDADIGMIWASDHYQVGFAANNIWEWNYGYPEVDRSRFKSDDINRKLDFHQKYTMQRQYRMEAAIYTDQRHWSLNFDADLNAITDPMRDQYQWVNIAAGYASDSWWLPSARVGFSKNLVGSKLRYLNAGATFAKIFNLDVSASLDKADIVEDRYFRGVTVTLGVQYDY
ncbi:conjugal transfer protein TraF [Thalassotalea agarivorans]|uniref:Plasmid transfer operon, TraF, protein n=1 Tax=Thalassotalea agarivorans TaxID=349064 RepID=A0A1I0CKN8_THASX|nr:conjugal transfer protein TraF [Thalassotalea agarivorans]SET19736.1 plasmid transfer operon, TraF, protein [Thalassotalea agarivorans]